MEEWVERYRVGLALALVAIVVFGGAVYLVRRPDARPIEIVTPTRAPKVSPQIIKVYVTGEVVNPGVYSLAEGDRVEDALKAAGGPIADADLVGVNLALKVRDQLQVHIPKLSAASSRPSGSSSDAPSSPGVPPKIDINTATAAELDSLPGVGPETAKRIISYRQQKGPFQRAEELKEAKLVNSSTFEKIKDLITAQ
ncbi:MAG: ComEA family DNA-binding protein [Dehalococcoidales bacterium]|nr:ComEA family DNA-binding protein [Dehalococcoidales bacterium]